MLRYKETEDIDARFNEVERVVTTWRGKVASANPTARSEFNNRLRISLIHHDAALEGEVLSYSEIKAAVDPSIISDPSLIPSYEEIRCFDDACNFAADLAAKKKPFKLDTLRDIYAILAPDEKAKGLPYRKENPLHRLYYHDITPPEKIQPAMRKLADWLDEPANRETHVIERVATLHSKFMAIFPWSKESGRAIRIASNLLLQEAGYPVAIVHSMDRQRYYEALKGDHMTLLSIYLEAVQTTAESEMRVYEEAVKAPPKKPRKKPGTGN
ncbi:MAG: Fic family protein [Kofleriaceae bacterium]|nr:Fic family protein [Kofleriaceae bacterium]